MNVQPIDWKDNRLVLLDQRCLPGRVLTINCETAEEVALAIEGLAVRGAPAIGIAAAYGVVLASKMGTEAARLAIARLSQTRPTAVNLFWALRRMGNILDHTSEGSSPEVLQKKLLAEADLIHNDDIAANKALGHYGQSLLPQKATVLTHCNAGALATGGYGTALGIIRAAREAGKDIRVLADETRPVLQGSRLTAWELMEESFDVTILCDSMAGLAMKKGKVDAVIVGADRVAANGDTANKIGTYSLAVLARHHGIPFYVAAPSSTLDPASKTGEDIPIEERSPEEVLSCQGKPSAPAGAKAWNPAFDVTPGDLLTAIVTEHGVIWPPFRENLRRLSAESDR